MKVGEVISMEWIRGGSGKAAQGKCPELWLEPGTALRGISLNQRVWRLQTTWMFSLVTHSLWQPIKTFVWLISQTQPQNPSFKGPWGMKAPKLPLVQLCQSCLGSPRALSPSRSGRGCSQAGAGQLGGTRGAAPALIPCPVPSPGVGCSHHNTIHQSSGCH